MGKRKKGRAAGQRSEEGGAAAGKRPQDKGRHVHPVETSSWQVRVSLILHADARKRSSPAKNGDEWCVSAGRGETLRLQVHSVFPRGAAVPL